jgi:hypothetical protein
MLGNIIKLIDLLRVKKISKKQKNCTKLWGTAGISMGYRRHLYEVQQASLWGTAGISMGYSRHLYGVQQASQA